MSSELETELLIIGGGPAGAASAIAARARGLDPLLLEASRFPRHHVGESLVNLWPVFEELGVATQMDDAFQHKHGSGRVWGRDPDISWTTFDLTGNARGYSLQVERSLFDLILLSRARELGADVREGHRVTELTWAGDRAIGARFKGPDGSERRIRSAFVVDASGRSGLIARSLHLREVNRFYPDLSIYGYVEDARRFPGDRAGALFIESVPSGWLWFIPLTETVSLGLVSDVSTRPLLKAIGPQQFLEDGVKQSRVVRELVEPGLLRGPVRATASSGYSSRAYSGPGWLAVGDAASFIDPMWATGVANALRDGILAAVTVDGVRSGRVGEGEALAYYDRELRERTEHLDEVVQFVYAANRLHAAAPFWRNRYERLGKLDDAGACLQRLSQDPAVRYFRAAFSAMGIVRELIPLENEQAEFASMERHADRLVGGDATTWIPQWSPGTRPRRGVGVIAGRMERGLEMGSLQKRRFTSNPRMVAALLSVNGRASADNLAAEATRDLPPAQRPYARLELLAGFRFAHAQGLLNALETIAA